MSPVFSPPAPGPKTDNFLISLVRALGFRARMCQRGAFLIRESISPTRFPGPVPWWGAGPSSFCPLSVVGVFELWVSLNSPPRGIHTGIHTASAPVSSSPCGPLLARVALQSGVTLKANAQSKRSKQEGPSGKTNRIESPQGVPKPTSVSECRLFRIEKSLSAGVIEAFSNVSTRTETVRQRQVELFRLANALL